MSNNRPTGNLDKIHRSKERAMPISNENIPKLEVDHLYHIGLDTQTHDLPKLFGDVKFVLMGGSANRMKSFAVFLSKEFGQADQQMPYNYAEATDRYVLYKVGPILIANHGIGIPSLSTIFHDVAKLLYHAGCLDVHFFRLGTSGGLGLEPGTVVISKRVLNGMLTPTWDLPILGEMVQQSAVPNEDLCMELKLIAEQKLSMAVVLGTTVCANDFFEGQGRLDGAFCSYSAEDRINFLRRLKEMGVTNLEMESVGFVAMCNKSNIPCAVICVTLLDRMICDQITADHDRLSEWQMRPLRLITEYIKQHMDN